MQERLLEAGFKKSIAGSSCSFWPSFILGDTLRIVFQNLLLESNEEILLCTERVWKLLLQVVLRLVQSNCLLYIFAVKRFFFFFFFFFGLGWGKGYHVEELGMMDKD